MGKKISCETVIRARGDKMKVACLKKRHDKLTVHSLS